MKLENQLTDLELSKKLESSGVLQDSLFYWVKDGEEWIIRDHYTPNKERISAFTVAELGEMLPHWCYSYKSVTGRYGCWSDDETACDDPNLSEKLQEEGTCVLEGGDFTAETEVDARAKMLIWLIEQGYINPRSIKE